MFRSSSILLSPLLLQLLLRATEGTAVPVPVQYVYENTTGASRVDEASGCVVREWEGMDQDGMAGYPWVASIDCPDGATFVKKGVSMQGHLRFFLRHGSMVVNGEEMGTMGDAFWISEGAHVSLSVSGFVYVVGAAFDLDETASEAVFTSSYSAPKSRAYRGLDAVNGVNNASNVHDAHIGNGTTNARDLVFSKGETTVDPPTITVLNCAPDGGYVWYHSHPFGALYIPYAGRICFDTDSSRCIEPGYPRWTSPNLFYYEHFEKIESTDTFADELIGLAFPAENATACEYPIVFGVTNFDPDDATGQPNFDDAPRGFSQWGVFERMVVRTTSVVSKSVVVDSEL